MAADIIDSPRREVWERCLRNIWGVLQSKAESTHHRYMLATGRDAGALEDATGAVAELRGLQRAMYGIMSQLSALSAPGAGVAPTPSDNAQRLYDSMLEGV